MAPRLHSFYPPDVLRDGVWYRWCSSCEGWPAQDRFWFDRKRLCRDRTCRTCRKRNFNRKRHPHLEANGYVPLSKVRHEIDYMVGVVGFRRTAERLGVGNGVLARWRGSPNRGRPLRHMQAKSVLRVLRASAQLRRDLREGAVPSGRVRSRGLCRGCGGRLDNRTDGCSSCWERFSRRERRAAS